MVGASFLSILLALVGFFESVRPQSIRQVLGPCAAARFHCTDLKVTTSWNTTGDVDLELSVPLVGPLTSQALQSCSEGQEENFAEAVALDDAQPGVYVTTVTQVAPCADATNTRVTSLVYINGNPQCVSELVLDGMFNPRDSFSFTCLEQTTESSVPPLCNDLSVPCGLDPVTVNVEWNSTRDLEISVRNTQYGSSWTTLPTEDCNQRIVGRESIEMSFAAPGTHSISLTPTGRCDSQLTTAFATVSIGEEFICTAMKATIFPGSSISQVGSFSCSEDSLISAPTHQPLPPVCQDLRFPGNGKNVSIALVWSTQDDLDLSVQFQESTVYTSAVSHDCNDPPIESKEIVDLGIGKTGDVYNASATLYNICPASRGVENYAALVIMLDGESYCSTEIASIPSSVEHGLFMKASFTVFSSQTTVNVSIPPAASPSTELGTGVGLPTDNNMQTPVSSPKQTSDLDAENQDSSNTTLLSPSPLRTPPADTAPEQSALATPSSSGLQSQNDACFPGSAAVTLESGGQKLMSDVVIGDNVLIAPHRYSTVFLMGHREPGVMFKFLEIESMSANVTLSASHLLYINGNLEPAHKARCGDQLSVVLNSRVISKSRIIRVRDYYEAGLYNPHTVHGDLIVNSVLVSSYTEAIPPSLAHGLLLPLRMAHWIAGLTFPGDWQPWTALALSYWNPK